MNGEPGGLQCIRLQRVGHDRAAEHTGTHMCMHSWSLCSPVETKATL